MHATRFKGECKFGRKHKSSMDICQKCCKMLPGWDCCIRELFKCSELIEQKWHVSADICTLSLRKQVRAEIWARLKRRKVLRTVLASVYHSLWGKKVIEWAAIRDQRMGNFKTKPPKMSSSIVTGTQSCAENVPKF